jgi:hypothetical protein
MKMCFKFSVLSAQLLAAVLPTLASDYKSQTLEQAHDMFRAATNSAMYAEAAKQYGYLVEEEGIRNGHLFYTLGNSWFMAGDVGRAILNYRRAQQFLPNHADVQQNLKVTRGMRTDLIPEKEPHPLAAKLLGWHLNTSISLRWRLFAFCWLLLWGAWFWMLRTSKKEARITTLATGVLSAILLTSLLTEFTLKQQAPPGVVTAREVLARKGDGNMYAPAFLEPLHSGTEFQSLEERGTWRHIRLADGQTCWIPAAAAEPIRLR